MLEHFVRLYDVIMDSTTHGEDSAFDSHKHVGAEISPSSSTLDHPLIGLGGPMTRSRAKKMKETLHDLVRNIHQATKPQVEEKSNFITLLKVIEE